MADDTPVDYSHIFNFLYRIDKRVAYLEKDLLYIERHIGNLESKRLENFNKLNDDVKKLHMTLISLKGNFNQCVHYMSTLGKDLQNCVKNDDMISLNNAVDEVKFEEYVVRTDLNRKMI